MKIYNLAFLWYIPIISGLLFLFPFACNETLEFPQSYYLPDSLQTQKRDNAGDANVVYKSTDGGQTWLDISEGLPKPVKDDYGVSRNVSFANDSGLYLTDGNGLYHSKPDAPAPFWTKEIFPDSLSRFIGEHSSITPGKTGIFAYNYWGGIFQKINGTSVWSPVFTNFQEKKIRTVFETTGGTVLIGTDKGLFKSTNGGNTWKQVNAGGWGMKLVESNGVLMAASPRGIIRSTDDGENWELVISEGGVGIVAEPIEGGFAVINYNTASKTRRVRTSYDGGKTWQPIDAGLSGQSFIASAWQPNNTGLPEQAFIASIVQAGEYFFCGHPAGIFRSSDKGKTWKLLLHSIGNKVFNLSVSGNVIYAIARNRGC